MKNAPLSRRLPFHFALLIAPLLAAWPQRAAAQTWNNYVSVGTTWSTAANWLPALAPTPSIDTVLTFGSSPFQTAVGYTTTNASGAFNLNSMIFDANGNGSGSITVTNTAVADTINFNTSTLGVLPSIVQNGAGRVTFRHQIGGATGIAITLAGGLTGTRLEVLGTGLGDLFLDGNIVSTGAGLSGLRINQTGTRRYNTGSVIRLGGSNSNYGGGVVLDAGNLMLSNVLGTSGAINLTASVAATTVNSLGSGTLTINGGSVQFDPLAISSGTSPSGISGTLQVNNKLTLNRDLNIAGTAPATAPGGNINGIFAGVIDGAGGINVVPLNGTSVFGFTAANTFTGAVTIKPVGNTVATVLAGTANVSTGSFSGASGFTVNSNSSLTLNNVFGVQTRLNTLVAPTLTLNRGNFNLFGNATTNSAETFGQLTTVGMGTLSVYNGSTTVANSTLTFASLNRGPDNKGTLSIAATNLGSGTGLGESILKFTADPGGAIGGGGGSGTTTRSILPYAISNSQATTVVNTAVSTAGTTLTTTVNGTSTPLFGLVRWDAGTQQVVPLNPTTEYATNLYLTGSAAPTANLRIATAASNVSSVAGLNNPGSVPYTVNALVLDTNNLAANQVGVSLAGSGTLKVAGGAILAGNNGGSQTITLPSMINLPVVDFGSTTGYLHAVANLTINSTISGSGGLVKSQTGTLILNGTNTFTGGLFANAGPVQFSVDANLGAAGEALILNSGLTAALSYLPGNVHTSSSSGTATVNRPVALGEAGAVISVGLANTTLVLSNKITGPGQLIKTGAGILELSGTNTYTGDNLISGGTLRAANDAALGAATSPIVLAGATFEPGSSFSTSRDFILTSGTGIVNTNGNNLTVNGDLTSISTLTANTLLKEGAGDLTLTAANTLQAGFQVGTSAPTVRVPGGYASTTAGRSVLSGANGALPRATSVLILGGGELVVDNSVVINNNRLPTATLGLAGNVTILGNTGGSVSESIGAFSHNVSGNAPFGGTLTLSQPASAGGAEVVALTATGTSTTATLGTIFVRGTNFGGASGDRTSLTLATTPIPINNVIPYMVGATSTTSEPTTFLTTSSIVVPAPNSNAFAVVPFSTYTAGGALGLGAAANTYDITAPGTTFTGAGLANALRISPTGSVSIGTTLTLSAGAVLATGGPNGGITGGTLAFGAVPARFTVTSTSPLTVRSIITGTAGFVKSGDGNLTLATAANLTTSATVSVAGGTLTYGLANALPVASNVFINTGATLDLNGNSSTLGSILSYGNVALGSGNLTLSSTTNPGVAFGGSLTGSGALIKTNTNTVTLNGRSPAYTGQTSILNGTLIVAGDSTLGTGISPILLGDTAVVANRAILQLAATATSFSRNIIVQTGSTPATPHALETAGAGTTNISSNILLGQTLRLQGTSGAAGGTTTLSGTVSETGGARSLFFFSGNWSVSGNNNYSGGTTFDTTTASWMGAASNTAFGSGSLTFTGNFGTNLRADGGARTLANNIILPSAAYFGLSGTNDLTLTGNVDLSAAPLAQTFTVTNTALSSLGGVISNGTGGITKNGPGTLELKGINTYSGATVINAGELKVNNPSGSATGSGVVTVNAGAVLSGTGFIVPSLGPEALNLVSIRSGGVLSPGNSPGNLTIGSLTTTGTATLDPGAVFKFQYTGAPAVAAPDTGTSLTPGSGNSIVTVNGSLNISSTSVISLAGNWADFTPGQTYSFLVGTATTAVSPFSITNPAQFDTTGFVGYTGAPLQWQNVGNNVYLNIVPEPASAGLAALALSSLALRRRRQA